VTLDEEQFDVASKRHVLVLEAGEASGTTGATSGPIGALRHPCMRDVTVRYKQTVIGVAWAIVRPFITMVIFTIVFGRLAGLPSESGAPYPVMVLAGMLPWFLFSSIPDRGIEQIVGNSNLIERSTFHA